MAFIFWSHLRQGRRMPVLASTSGLGFRLQIFIPYSRVLNALSEMLEPIGVKTIGFHLWMYSNGKWHLLPMGPVNCSPISLIWQCKGWWQVKLARQNTILKMFVCPRWVTNWTTEQNTNFLFEFEHSLYITTSRRVFNSIDY